VLAVVLHFDITEIQRDGLELTARVVSRAKHQIFFAFGRCYALIDDFHRILPDWVFKIVLFYYSYHLEVA